MIYWAVFDKSNRIQAASLSDSSEEDARGLFLENYAITSGDGSGHALTDREWSDALQLGYHSARVSVELIHRPLFDREALNRLTGTLKACPLCRSSHIRIQHEPELIKVRIMCSDCGIELPAMAGGDEYDPVAHRRALDAATKAWNSRKENSRESEAAS